MTRDQAVAYVHAQAVAAQIALEACLAANRARERAGYAAAYGEQDIARITDEYGISHNAVLALFLEHTS